MAGPLDLIRAAAASYPEAERAFLFGDHEVYRVKKKVFVWLGDNDDGGTYVSVKLKDTMDAALMLPFVEPASYGMHKWGWVGANFPKNKLPTEMVLQWLEESYRHTAPKKLLKALDERMGVAPAAKAVTRKKKPAKKRGTGVSSRK